MKKIHQTSLLLIFTLILSSCTSNCNHQEKDINNSRPENAITYKEMAAMFHQYDIGQKQVLDNYRREFTNGKDSVETISHYFEIDQLKQYINYIEKLSKDKNIDLTGFRVFSAAYPKNYKREPKLSGRHSLIFMPTTNIKGKNIAFEPLYSKKGQPERFTNFLNKFASSETRNVQRASFLSFLQEEDPEDILSSGLNRAQSTPPY